VPRISGINIPENKKIKIALTEIHGIGKLNTYKLLRKADIDFEKRTKDLTDAEIARLQKAVEQVSIEGSLRKMVSENIKRLKQIDSYRGQRHSEGLPVRGQRTRTNARTKRGKRKTVGALKKELAEKMAKGKKQKDKAKE
jgi:small subunit ribosomal protein S13